MIEQNFKEKFISLFPLSESNFIEPVIFTKGFGFSVKRKYETGILKKYLGSNENWVSLIKVFIDDNDLSKKIVKIKGSASLYFRGEENFEVNRPRIEKKIFGPIDLFSEGEFFFSTENFHFFSKTKKSEVPTLDILKYLYDCHIKPTRTFYGLYLRLKLLDQLIDDLFFQHLL